MPRGFRRGCRGRLSPGGMGALNGWVASNAGLQPPLCPTCNSCGRALCRPRTRSAISAANQVRGLLQHHGQVEQEHRPRGPAAERLSGHAGGRHPRDAAACWPPSARSTSATASSRWRRRPSSTPTRSASSCPTRTGPTRACSRSRTRTSSGCACATTSPRRSPATWPRTSSALPSPSAATPSAPSGATRSPGPGRFRQFTQFDADTVGTDNIAADAEICMLAADTMEALGIKRGDYVIKVNNRKVLDGVMEASALAATRTRQAADRAARHRQA